MAGYNKRDLDLRMSKWINALSVREEENVEEERNTEDAYFQNENQQSENPLEDSPIENEENEETFLLCKGYVLLFFNETFAKDEEGEFELKSGKQPKRMEKFFNDIGFSVRTFINWSVNDIQEKITRYASRKQSCFVCFISSHGSHGEVWDKNRKCITVKTLVGFADTHELKGIPKCFFICACRHIGENISKYDGEPNTYDTLIGYAALSGQESQHYLNGGSVYFDFILKHLEESSQLPARFEDKKNPKKSYSRNIDRILKKVGRDMERELKYRPVYHHTLNCEIFFRYGNS